MKQIDAIGSGLINQDLKKLVQNDVQKIINTCLNEAIKSVSEGLTFKLVPIDNESFKLEAKWQDLPVDLHGS